MKFNKEYYISLIGLLFSIVVMAVYIMKEARPSYSNSISNFIGSSFIPATILFIIGASSLVSIIVKFLNSKRPTDNYDRKVSEIIAKNEKVTKDIEDVLEEYTKSDSKIAIPVMQPISELIPQTINPIISNIQSYIFKLNSNSIVNLLIGIFGTIFSISVLTYSLISRQQFPTLELFVLNFLPKISFVIFIQLFAFFFLKLYKSNLADSKYFQNELTNMLAKSTALELAFKIDNKDLIAKLIENLAMTERNFKLAAGETLLNLEKTKLENEFDKELLSQLKEFITKK